MARLKIIIEGKPVIKIRLPVPPPERPHRDRLKYSRRTKHRDKKGD